LVKLKRTDDMEYVSVHGRIILKQILEKSCGRMEYELIRFRVGSGGRLL
jgi:hypothetical protein